MGSGSGFRPESPKPRKPQTVWEGCGRDVGALDLGGTNAGFLEVLGLGCRV